MRLSLVSLSLLTACSLFGEQDAETAILMTAISGEEEYSTARSDGPPDPFRPELGRECDASGEFDRIFGLFDEDSDKALNRTERGDVKDELGSMVGQGGDSEGGGMGHHGQEGGPPPPLMDLLTLVYDLDDDGAFSESERATILDDFTVRCESIQAMLLESFDADGDGALSEAELDTAREALDALREEHGHDMDGACPEGEGGEGGHRGPPEGPPEGLSPLAQEFDADGDGELSDSEHETLRSVMRERIRTGAPPSEDAPPPMPGAEEASEE
jgi:hypothetical protein